MTKLQVALDGDLSSMLDILSQIHPYIDIAEIGTPLIYREGMHAVRTVCEAYPDLTVLADLKIMDAGEEEAQIAFDAGASLVTVLGVTHDATIQGAVNSARQSDGQIVVDMMQVQNLTERGSQLLDIGCDVLCVHTAFDLQALHDSPYHELDQLRQRFPSANLAIAGGVNSTNLDDILPYRPDIIVVGGAITRADNPTLMAQQLYERINNDEN